MRLRVRSEKLLEDFNALLEFESIETVGSSGLRPHCRHLAGPATHPPLVPRLVRSTGPDFMASGRLLTLVKQAVAYQIESSRYHPRMTPKITTYDTCGRAHRRVVAGRGKRKSRGLCAVSTRGT